MGHSLDVTHRTQKRPSAAEDGAEEPSKSRFVTLLQGSIVFVVMFVSMYLTLQRLLFRGDDRPE
jgi:hypothetical protein